uniref:uncharacterized protein LOC106674987 n=1 Tax=Maylandia zebra TaxID=106582 RepID=UPI000C2379A5|nr:uncharacterized protein LOC106674987 [Maylandia zebra]
MYAKRKEGSWGMVSVNTTVQDETMNIHEYITKMTPTDSVLNNNPTDQLHEPKHANQCARTGTHFKEVEERTQFWIELFSDLRERHLFNGSHEHKCLLRYVFLNVLQKELDEYRDLWNTHTIRPVRQSCCPSGKPEAMYHLPHRYGGRECGFQVPQDILHQFDDILPAQYSLCGDDNLQVHFTNLERQSELPRPVNWTTAVENYITLKNMTGL